MLHYRKILLAIAASQPLMAGCGMWPSKGLSEITSDQDEVDQVAVAKAAQQQKKLSEEQELKVAKLWARVDELEDEQMRQKGRLALVEKGLTLGLVPDELRRPERKRRVQESTDDKRAALEPRPSASDHAKPREATASLDLPEAADQDPSRQNTPNLSAEPQVSKSTKKTAQGQDTSGAASGPEAERSEAYQKALANAQDQFRSGRYGRAIVEYSDLGKRYGDQVAGAAHLYWIAKSWFNLKEYGTARQQFAEFLKAHGDSPWAPRAKFELARVEWQLGMQETSVKRFRDLIKEHPNEDAAEMAKMELQTLDKKL